MPALAFIVVCFWLAPFTGSRAAVVMESSAPEARTIDVIQTTAEIPQGDLRRVRLPWMRAGDSLIVQFRVEGQPEGPESGEQARPDPIHVEILRRERSWFGRVDYRQLRSALAAGQGEFEWRVPEDGDYVVALRKAASAGLPSRVTLGVKMRRHAGLTVTRISTAGRLAVLSFSLGFLLTVFSSCGVPIIRAFRARKRPPSPPWFG